MTAPGCDSAQTLISSPLTKGMIHGAIMQSGGGLGGHSKNSVVFSCGYYKALSTATWKFRDKNMP